jgi:hypothetical protein
MIEAAPNLMHRTILMVLYVTGSRRIEASLLKVTDADSERMVIHSVRAKVSRDEFIERTGDFADKGLSGSRPHSTSRPASRLRDPP